MFTCVCSIRQRTKDIGRGSPGLEQKSRSRKLLRITIHASHLLSGTKEAFFLFFSCLRKGARYSSAENVFSDELLPGLLVEYRNEEEVSRWIGLGGRMQKNVSWQVSGRKPLAVLRTISFSLVINLKLTAESVLKASISFNKKFFWYNVTCTFKNDCSFNWGWYIYTLNHIH